MSPFASTLIFLMAVGTVVLDVIIVGKVLALFKPSWRSMLKERLRRHGLLLVFILSIASVVGTLIMQFLGALAPCDLCWWQRICMYPIALMSFIAIMKQLRISDIADYVIWFSVIGFLVALYQHLLQMLPQGALIPCSASNECAIRSVFYFNFVTVPWMAMTVFAALFLIAILTRSSSRIDFRNR